MRDRDPERFALEAVGRHDERARHDAVGDRRRLAHVEVVEELVEGGDPLDEALLDRRPLVRRDDAGHQIHRPHALDPSGLAVNVEGDAERAEDRIAEALAAPELFDRDRAQARDESAVRRPNFAVRREDLVEEPLALILGEGIVAGDGIGSRVSCHQESASLGSWTVGPRESASGVPAMTRIRPGYGAGPPRAICTPGEQSVLRERAVPPISGRRGGQVSQERWR
jgi:hypothetical protein